MLIHLLTSKYFPLLHKYQAAFGLLVERHSQCAFITTVGYSRVLEFDFSLLELGNLSKYDSELDKTFWLHQLISSFMILDRPWYFAFQIEENDSVSDANFDCILIESSCIAIEDAHHTLLENLCYFAFFDGN